MHPLHPLRPAAGCPAMADWIEFTSPSTNFAVCYCTNLSAPDWKPWLFGNGEITVASTTIDALNPRRVIVHVSLGRWMSSGKPLPMATAFTWVEYPGLH